MKLKAVVCVIAALTSLLSKSHGDEGSLPTDSQNLLASLAKFEEAERFKFEVKMEEKRKQVATLLNTHLTRETESGNLGAAAALKNAIASLEGAEATTQPEHPQAWLSTWADARSAFGRTELTVSATRNGSAPLLSKLRLREGEKFLIVPNPDDKWTGGGTRAGKYCDFRGYYPDRKQMTWMRLYYVIGDGEAKPVDPTKVVQASRAGSLKFFAEDANPKGNRGEVQLVVIPQR